MIFPFADFWESIPRTFKGGYSRLASQNTYEFALDWIFLESA
jgi:hypothetical protein